MKPPIGPVLEHFGWDGRVFGHGPWHNTRCPFHEDRNPSARVNLTEQVFHCFLCDGISGDAYTVVETIEHVDFLKAKQLIEQWTGYTDVDNPPGHTSRTTTSTGMTGSYRQEKLTTRPARQQHRKLVLR